MSLSNNLMVYANCFAVRNGDLRLFVLCLFVSVGHLLLRGGSCTHEPRCLYRWVYPLSNRLIRQTKQSCVGLFQQEPFVTGHKSPLSQQPNLLYYINSHPPESHLANSFCSTERTLQTSSVVSIRQRVFTFTDSFLESLSHTHWRISGGRFPALLWATLLSLAATYCFFDQVKPHDKTTLTLPSLTANAEV